MTKNGKHFGWWIIAIFFLFLPGRTKKLKYTSDEPTFSVRNKLSPLIRICLLCKRPRFIHMMSSEVLTNSNPTVKFYNLIKKTMKIGRTLYQLKNTLLYVRPPPLTLPQKPNCDFAAKQKGLREEQAGG